MRKTLEIIALVLGILASLVAIIVFISGQTSLGIFFEARISFFTSNNSADLMHFLTRTGYGSGGYFYLLLVILPFLQV